MRRRYCTLLVLVSLVLVSGPRVSSALPGSAEDRAKVIGQPTALIVQPASVSLTSLRSVQQLIVTGKYADGSVRDLTASVLARVEGGHVSLSEGLFLEAVKAGSGSVHIEAAGLKVTVPIVVAAGDRPAPISFRNEMIAALNVGGCNQGACHGTPSGKNGFKLSLRGYDPAADYFHLTHDVLGRRSDSQRPEESLIYLKALGRVAHEGGSRFSKDSLPARTMLAWLAEGSQNDLASAVTIKKVEVLPGGRVLNEPARWQQLAVVGHFSDGSVRDVTRLTVFSSSDTAIASVSPSGLVEFQQGGEVAILCRYLEEMVPVRLTYLQPKPGFKWTNPPENNYVDRHIFSKLKMLNIAPSELCSDHEFIRRATMDVCGVLPAPEEVRAFLASKEPDRRAKLIDRLLERPEYADYWTLKWADVLRSSRKTLQVKGMFAYHQWIHDQIARNVPFDQTVRQLITAEGGSLANPAANYYRVTREPNSLAETTAQLFFGIRMQCAKCHNHPFERWTQDDYYSMAAFFAQVKQKPDPKSPEAKKDADFVFIDKNANIVHPRTGKVAEPRFLGDPLAKVPGDVERRQALAVWMTSANNAFFARSTVNRIWFHVNGRGIVDPVDDFRDSNPSANDELLDALAKDFAASNFDVKHVIRAIMNSRTYQLSAQTNEFNKDDNKYFSHAITRLYSAEPLFDALCNLTGVPETFAGMPAGTRAVQLPDGDANHPFLKAFGQPARELACECERESDSNLTQALQLINGKPVNDRVRDPNNRLAKLMASKKSNGEMLEELFLIALSRPPSMAEAKELLAYVHDAADKRKAWEDILWTLINAKEFYFRH